jgi:hypothetical protein
MGREAATPSNIKKIQEIQRGQEAPHDGGAIILKEVEVTPFRPKGLINSSPNTRFPSGSKGIDGLSSDHPNLNGSYPGLLKDFPKGILVIEKCLAFFRSKEVEDEVAKDVKQLSDVGINLLHGTFGPGGVIFSLEDGFTQHDK